MKKVFLGVIVGVAMSAAALAQNSPALPPPASGSANAAAAANAPRIAPGSVIPVQLTKSVDAKKAKTGDQVVAMVTQDMKNQNGEVLVPKETKVIGHITEAQARSKEQKESQLAIAFDQAVLKGEQVQMPMSIQAVVAPQNNNNDDASAVPSGTPSPGSPAGTTTSPMARPGGAGQPQAQQPTPQPDDSGNPGKRLPPINGQTQGVIGISHMTLSAGSSPAQGSVLTSDKNNVKLESGTMLLLKVQ
jgi:hypothetical protein